MTNELPDNKKTEDASEHVRRTAENIKQVTSDAIDRVADHAESAIEHGHEVFDDAMAHADDWTNQACGYVREKPVRSMAMALAVGWMLGRLMRR